MKKVIRLNQSFDDGWSFMLDAVIRRRGGGKGIGSMMFRRLGDHLGERQCEDYQSSPDTYVRDLRNCPSLTVRVGIVQTAAGLSIANAGSE